MGKRNMFSFYVSKAKIANFFIVINTHTHIGTWYFENALLGV